MFRYYVNSMNDTRNVRSIESLFSLDIGENEIAFLFLGYSGIILRTDIVAISIDPGKSLSQEEIRMITDLDLLFFHYGPPGHPNRDEWWWLDPRNRGRPRLALE